MNVAIVGCGFVADYYLTTLASYPELTVVGIVDKYSERAKRIASAYGIQCYESLAELLSDDRVQLVLNLTDPRSHYAVSHAALSHGKHVYSEKPLAMRMDEARELVAIAESRALGLAAAPCSMLGETAQTIWKLLRDRMMGPVRLVYAEMDDGYVSRMPFRAWKSSSGVPWPYKDEFEIGCTLEHAAYCLSWLAAWFGPATSVTSFASVLIEQKTDGESLDLISPDFTVSCIRFTSGPVARITCGIVAPRDHSLKIICDGGVLYTGDCWDYFSTVRSRRMLTWRRKSFLNPIPTKHRLLRSGHKLPNQRGSQRMDFARGPAEFAAAIRDRRTCRLSAHFSLHINEVVLAMHGAFGAGAEYHVQTTFEPIDPMPWAC